MRADARTLRLHVAIASATVSACGAGLGTCKGCSVACRVTARDAGSGKPLGSADLAATCGRPKGWFAQGGDLPIGVDEPDRCRRSVVANLAGQIVKTLRTAKQCSRQWESGIMGCGC